MARLGFMRARRRRAGAATAAVCLAVGTWSAAQAEVRGSMVEGEPLAVSEVGGYLAARHARVLRDYPAAADFLGGALTIAPDDLELQRRAVDALLLDGRIEDAADVARRLVEGGGESAQASLTLAVTAVAAGDIEDVDARIDGLRDSAVNRILKPLIRMWAYFGAGRIDDARAAASELKENEALATVYHVQSALLEEAAGERDRALELYAGALDSQGGSNPRLVQLAGEFYERAGRVDEAIALYREHLQTGRRSAVIESDLARAEGGGAPPKGITTASEGLAEALFWMAAAVSRRNDPETALMFARLGLALKPDLPVLQVLAAQLLQSVGRLESANAIYAELDRASPLATEVQLDVANNLERLDRFDEAREVLQALALEQPDDPQALVALGDMMRTRERFHEAVEAYDAAFERIPELEPRHWRLLYARGIALERAKKWERAEADFLKSLEFEPDQPFVLNYLGYSWIDQGRNLDRALEMVERAVDQRPRDGYIVDSLGWAHYKLGNYEEAVRKLERAVELRPQDPVINDHLGDAYWKVGRLREARFQWEAAKQFDPDPEVLATIKEKLERGLVEETAEAPSE